MRSAYTPNILVRNFSNIFFISILTLGLIFSPLALAEFTFAQELGTPEDVGKPDDISKKEEKQAEREARLAEKQADREERQADREARMAEKKADRESRMAEKKADREARMAEKQADREARLAEKLAQVQQRLSEKTSQLEKREQALLGKLNEGSYHGPLLGGDPVTNQYIVSFDALDATVIGNSGDSETFAGDITLENVVSRGNNLKLKVTGCNLIGDLVTYDCAFGKARAISSGPGGDKDSLVIIAFLEDDLQGRSTLKIMLDADVPIKELEGSTDALILSPQSRISHDWFIGGGATVTVTGSAENLDFTGIIESESTDEEEAAEKAAEAEAEAAEEAAEAEAEAAEEAAEAEAEAAEVEEPEVEVAEVEVEEPEVEPTEPTEPET